MITLVTMSQGNPVAFARTVDSVKEKFGDLLTEVVVGTLCPFEDDRDKIAGFRGKIAVDVFTYRYDLAYIFNNGFSAILNNLALRTQNNLCLYMNVSEVIEGPVNTGLIHPQYNCYRFDHATEEHKWLRLWDKRECKWSGRIHEEVVGGVKCCPEILFRMADTEKDNGNPFRAWVYDFIKDVTYHQQYNTISLDEREVGATNRNWVDWAKVPAHFEDHKQKVHRYPQLLAHFITDNQRDFIPEAYKCWQQSLADNDPYKNTQFVHYQSSQ